MIRLEDYHWALWAYEACESDLVYHGYPAAQPFYTPPRRGNIDEPLSGGDPPTDDDYTASRLIAMGVDKLSLLNSEAAALLIEWFGAYPGAPTGRGQRIMRVGINPRTARALVNEHRRWVEGWVFSHQEFHHGALSG